MTEIEHTDAEVYQVVKRFDPATFSVVEELVPTGTVTIEVGQVEVDAPAPEPAASVTAPEVKAPKRGIRKAAKAAKKAAKAATTKPAKKKPSA